MDNKTITVSHINIRLSISILLIKLIFIEVLAALLVIFFHTSLFVFGGEVVEQYGLRPLMLSVIGSVVFLKLISTIFVIIQWLNEYYEITKDFLYHRRGVLFKSEEKFPLEHIAYVEISQGILGKIFNYGSISLFDRRRNKYEDMYLIHNPMRYAGVIETLLPNADEEKQIIRENVFEKNIFDIADEE